MALTDNRRNRRSSQRKRCRPGTHSLTGARPFAGSKEKPPEARPGQTRPGQVGREDPQKPGTRREAPGIEPRTRRGPQVRRRTPEPSGYSGRLQGVVVEGYRFWLWYGKGRGRAPREASLTLIKRFAQRKRCRPGTHSLTGARPFAGRKEKPPKARPPPGSQRTGRPASQAARQALYILITF